MFSNFRKFINLRGPKSDSVDLLVAFASTSRCLRILQFQACLLQSLPFLTDPNFRPRALDLAKKSDLFLSSPQKTLLRLNLTKLRHLHQIVRSLHYFPCFAYFAGVSQWVFGDYREFVS